MGLFSNSKGSSRDNSGTAGKNFTVTGTAGRKQKIGSMRKEWTAPRKGGGNRRPGQ